MNKQQLASILSTEETEELRKQLFLYVVGLRDLKVAESCFNELKDLPIGVIADLNNVGKTFAFIVCYGRIFHNNEGIGKLKIQNFIDTLSTDEKKTHKALMSMRNENYAHNDPQHNNLFIHYNADEKKISAIAQFSYHPLSYNKDEIFSLIQKMHAMLETERDKLLEQLYPAQQLALTNESRSYIMQYHSGFIARQITDKG